MSRAFRWLLILSVPIVLLAVFHRLWLSALGGYLVHTDAATPADMIVVLAGDFAGNRILTAGELVRSGMAPKALVSGPSDFYDLHETDIEIPFAVRNGYSASYFDALPNDSKSTASEADVVLAELRKRNVHRVDIVTSNFHTRRAGNIYRSKAPDLEIRMVPSPDKYFSPDGWWKDREGQKKFLTEWQKTVAGWCGL